MKPFLLLCTCLISIPFSIKAQSTYEILKDPADNNAKMLKGIVTKSDLSNDPAFTWYAESQRMYSHPDTATIGVLKRNKNDIYFLIFGGTWCSDTHYVLPKFFKIQEASGFPENRMVIFATDRAKHTTGVISQALNITRVPTIIVMKDGKELGRVVEYGKTGNWAKELAEIIN